MAKTIFGWGGVKIAGCEFTTAIGKIEFQPEYVRNKTTAGKYIQHFKGWRPIITMTIFNDSDTYGALLVTLIDRISYYQTLNQAIYIYPRYTSTDAGSVLQYACFLDSNITPADLTDRANVMQTIDLKFIGESLIDELPTNYSGQTLTYVTDESANKYVDESGNKYVTL